MDGIDVWMSRKKEERIDVHHVDHSDLYSWLYDINPEDPVL